MFSSRRKFNQMSILFGIIFVSYVTLNASSDQSSLASKRNLKAKAGLAESDQPSRSLPGQTQIQQKTTTQTTTQQYQQVVQQNVGGKGIGTPPKDEGIRVNPLFHFLNDDLQEDEPVATQFKAAMAEKAESRFEKLQTKMVSTLEKMASAQDMNVKHEVTLDNICDISKITNPDDFIQPYIIKQFRQSKMTAIETAMEAKATLQVHFTQIKDWQTNLNKFKAEKVQQLSIYFESVRIKTVIYFVSSLLSLAPKITLAKSATDSLLKKFVQEIKTYTFSKDGLENQSAQMLEIYRLINHSQGNDHQKYYLELFPKATAEAIHRVGNDKLIASTTCSVILGITRLYISGNADPAFNKMNKMIGDNLHMKEFVLAFFESFKSVFWIDTDHVGNPTQTNPKRYLENCEELASTTVKYRNLFGFISKLKVGADLSDPQANFIARYFFTKSFLKGLKELNKNTYRTIIDFDLFVMFNENDSTDDMFTFLLSYKDTFVKFNALFFNDLATPPDYFKNNNNVVYPSDYHLDLFASSKANLSEDEQKFVENGRHINIVLKAVYLLYVYERSLNWNPQQKMELQKELAEVIYKRLYEHWVSLETVDKIVQETLISPSEVTTYYFDILNFLCTKAKTCGTLPAEKIKVIIKKYTVITKTVITITTYKWTETFSVFFLREKAFELVELFRIDLRTIKFKQFDWKCFPDTKSTECTEQLSIHTSFITIITKHIFLQTKIDELYGYDKTFNQKEGFFIANMIKILLTFQINSLKEESKSIIIAHLFYYIQKSTTFFQLKGINQVLLEMEVFFKTLLTKEVGKYDHIVFLELFNTIFGLNKIDASTGELTMKVSVTKEHVTLIEDILYYVIVPVIEKDKNTAVARTTVIKTIITNLRIRIIKKLDSAHKNISSYDDWKKLKLAEENAQDLSLKWKKIIVFMRLILIMKTNIFFKAYNASNFAGFKSLRDYRHQNPLTVIYNFFILAAQDTVKDRFEVDNFCEHLFFKIKTCMVKNGGAKYNEADLQECPWSFRKYGELYYFVAYVLNTIGKSDISMVDYFEKDQMLVHIRIFVAVLSVGTTMRGEYDKVCETDTEATKPFCLMLEVFWAVWEHLKNTDTLALSAESFNEKIMAIFAKISGVSKVLPKFILLAIAEVLTYMSSQELHYDRFKMYMDPSEQSFLNSPGKTMTQESKTVMTSLSTFIGAKYYLIDKNNNDEKTALAIYLRRTFGKVDYNVVEKPTRQGVSMLLAMSEKTFDQYFKYDDIDDLSMFKIVLSFASGEEYNKIANFLAKSEIYLQIPNMNNPNKESNVETFLFLMACPDIQAYEDKDKYKNLKKSCYSKITPNLVSDQTRNANLQKLYKLLSGIYPELASQATNGLDSDNDDEYKQTEIVEEVDYTNEISRHFEEEKKEVSINIRKNTDTVIKQESTSLKIINQPYGFDTKIQPILGSQQYTLNYNYPSVYQIRSPPLDYYQPYTRTNTFTSGQNSGFTGNQQTSFTSNTNQYTGGYTYQSSFGYGGNSFNSGGYQSQQSIKTMNDNLNKFTTSGNKRDTYVKETTTITTVKINGKVVDRQEITREDYLQEMPTQKSMYTSTTKHINDYLKTSSGLKTQANSYSQFMQSTSDLQINKLTPRYKIIEEIPDEFGQYQQVTHQIDSDAFQRFKPSFFKNRNLRQLGSVSIRSLMMKE